MNQLVLSPAFQRQLKKLIKQNPRYKNKITKVLKFLIEDINHPSLRLHKLSGEDNWSVSLAEDIQIVIHWKDNQVFCLRIGSHNQVY